MESASAARADRPQHPHNNMIRVSSFFIVPASSRQADIDGAKVALLHGFFFKHTSKYADGAQKFFVELAAGENDAAKIVIDAGKIQVTGAPLTLNAEPTDEKHAATKGYVDAALAALEARVAALEGGEA